MKQKIAKMVFTLVAIGISISSLHATDRNKYVSAENRIPKEADLLFRAIDSKNGDLIADASIKVFVDGIEMKNAPATSGKGEFTIRVADTCEITIIATKNGYEVDNLKIRNRAVRYLLRAAQTERDIIFSKIQDGPAPCNQIIKPTTSGNFEEEYFMGSPNSKFVINYDMSEEPDRMVIYCGRKGENGKVLFDTEVPVSRSQKSGAAIDLAKCGGSSWITVKVIGKADSQWQYSFDCIR